MHDMFFRKYLFLKISHILYLRRDFKDCYNFNYIYPYISNSDITNYVMVFFSYVQERIK